jgi:hypothetical protein
MIADRFGAYSSVVEISVQVGINPFKVRIGWYDSSF